jgi:methylenetetrahydrofolate reductase (NADPH)
MPDSPPTNDRLVAQFEVLPLDTTEQEVARLERPVQLTVTCSPRHGPDESVEVGRRLAGRGHEVTIHVAARMVRDRAHLDRLLTDMARSGMDDLFLIGGDADPPDGPYSSAGELLPVIAEHPQRPRTIGIAGYPEGHPQIDPDTLAAALVEKSALSDYVTTQLCFDPDAVLAWIDDTRRRGVTLPVLVGIPGAVERRRLLKMAMRVGVGPSVGFLRKQRGIRNLLGLSASANDRLYDALAPCLADPQRNIGGFHYYTFNQLVDTWNWQVQKAGGEPRPAGAAL